MAAMLFSSEMFSLSQNFYTRNRKEINFFRHKREDAVKLAEFAMNIKQKRLRDNWICSYVCDHFHCCI